MRIGPYEVEDVLGRGGMGVVYRARSASGEAVALKVLGKIAGDAVLRFERERRLLGELGVADGFVPLLDAGESEKGPFVVMPFMNGGTLRERLRRGPLGVEATVELGRDLARALGAAHARGIVHRDLKPENVLFHDGRPLVADLGLAKHFDRGSPGASQTVSLSVDGSVLGTAGYMPPEQMSDTKSVGPAADVFALGAILHECLAGKPAYAGKTPLEAAVAVADGKRDRLGRAEAPVWLARTVERALAPSPGDRFADGRALLAALERGRATATTRLLLALGGVSVLVAASALVLGLRSKDEPRAATPAETVPRKTVPDPLAVAKRLRAGGAPEPGDLAVLLAARDRSELLRSLVFDATIFPLAEVRAARREHPDVHDLATLEALAVLAGPASTHDEFRAAVASLRAARLDRTAAAFLAVLAVTERRLEGDLAPEQPRDEALAKLFEPIAKRPELVLGAVAPLASACRSAVLDTYVQFSGLERTSVSSMKPYFNQLSVLDEATGLPPEVAVAHAALRDVTDAAALVSEGRTRMVERCFDAGKARETSDPVLAAFAYAVGCDHGYSIAAHAAAEHLTETSLAGALDDRERYAVRLCYAHLAWQETRWHVETALQLPVSERAPHLEKALVAARTELARARTGGLSERSPLHRTRVLQIVLGHEVEGLSHVSLEEDPLTLVVRDPLAGSEVESRLTDLIDRYKPNDFVKSQARALRARVRRVIGGDFVNDLNNLKSITNRERAFEIALEQLAAERLRLR